MATSPDVSRASSVQATADVSFSLAAKVLEDEMNPTDGAALDSAALNPKRSRRPTGMPSWMLMGVSLILLGLLWSNVASAEAARLGVVPTPQATLVTMVELLTRKLFWDDLLTTVYRLMTGFLVSLAIGVPLGLGIGLSHTLSALLGGIIGSLKYTPVSAFIPLSIILFGVGDGQKVAVLLLATGPYVAAMTADAVRSVHTEYVESALTLGASRFQVIGRVILASAAPQIWNAARLALAIAWTYVVTAELVGASTGLGRFLMRAERFFNTREMLAAVLIIAAIGWLSDLIFRLVYGRRFRWAVLTSHDHSSE